MHKDTKMDFSPFLLILFLRRVIFIYEVIFVAVLSGDEFKITKIENVEHVNTLLKPNRIVNYNRFSHGFVYKISGEVKYHFGDVSLHFTPGSICYFPKGSDFTIENIVLGECIAVNFQTLEDVCVPPFCFDATQNEQIRAAFQKLEILWAKRKSDFGYDILSQVYKIADFIQDSMQADFCKNKGYKSVRDIQQFLQDNFTDPNIKISDICSKFKVSVSSARENFNEIFGVSPKKYLTVLRINEAKKYLLETDLAIFEIAEKCGFDDAFYFSRCFSKFCACSPSEFRKIHSSL